MDFVLWRGRLHSFPEPFGQTLRHLLRAWRLQLFKLIEKQRLEAKGWVNTDLNAIMQLLLVFLKLYSKIWGLGVKHLALFVELRDWLAVHVLFPPVITMTLHHDLLQDSVDDLGRGETALGLQRCFLIFLWVSH